MGLFVDIHKKLPDFDLNIKFEVGNGVLALLGESGCGKSLTLKCISGLITPDKGKIILDDKILFDSEKNINLPIQKRNIGFLFQNYGLFSKMNVYHNIGYALNKDKEKASIVNKYLSMMQIDNLKDKFPSELSGGQQQRVALARALAVEPCALFLDEPFSALDNHLRSMMISQMQHTLSEFKGTTIFVTHNMEEAYALSENIAIISKGKIIDINSKEAIFKSPKNSQAAKVTGCKNLSKIKVINDYLIEAIDWNCKLQLSKPISKDTSAIGIRAHYIDLFSKVSSASTPASTPANTYDAWLCNLSILPFRVYLYLKLHTKPMNSEDFTLIVDMSKEEWQCLNLLPQPWKLRLDEENFIYMND